MSIVSDTPAPIPAPSADLVPDLAPAPVPAITPSAPSKPVMELEGLHHELLNRRSDDKYSVIIDRLVFPKESFICILGESGCGKTTLLTLIGLARKPEQPVSHGTAVKKFVIREATPEGEKEHDLVNLWDNWRGRKQIEGLRRNLLGFALQSGELLPTLTLEENVSMPLYLNRWKSKDARARVRELLDSLSPPLTKPKDEPLSPVEAEPPLPVVGETPLPVQAEPLPPVEAKSQTPVVKGPAKESYLWERRKRLPADISGGQYQRVALARALAHKPRLLFVDEPTGNLDSVTARQALDLLNKLRTDAQTTVVMITHDEQLASDYAQHIVKMGVIGEKTGGIIGFKTKTESGEWIEVDGLDTLNPITQPAATVPNPDPVVAKEVI